MNPSDISSRIRSAEVVVPCPDLGARLYFFTERLGFRVALLFPADSPSIAVVSGHGLPLRLEAVLRKPDTVVVLRLLCDREALPVGAQQTLVAPDGTRVELVDADPPVELPDGKQELILTHLSGDECWGVGRAG